MKEKSVSVVKQSLTYGVYLGIAMVLVSLIYYATGSTFSKSVQWVSYGVLIIGIIVAQLFYRNSLGNVMTYGQALSAGVLTVIFASVISGFFTYLLYAIIDPSLQEQMKLAIEEELVTKGKLPEEQIELAIEMASKFQKPAIMFIMSIFSGAFSGLIISLVTSIFTQKKPASDFPG